MYYDSSRRYRNETNNVQHKDEQHKIIGPNTWFLLNNIVIYGCLRYTEKKNSFFRCLKQLFQFFF